MKQDQETPGLTEWYERIQAPPATRKQAIAQARLWGNRLSHTNQMLAAEAGPEHRTQTLLHIAQADAAEAVRLCALAAVLPEEEP